MTQLVLNIEDASLVPSLRHILASIKGVSISKNPSASAKAEAEKAFITDTITRGFEEAREGRFAAKNLSSLNSLIRELKADE